MDDPKIEAWTRWMEYQLNFYNNTKIILQEEDNATYILIFDFSDHQSIKISLIINNCDNKMEVYSSKITQGLLSDHFSKVQIRANKSLGDLYKLFGNALQKLTVDFGNSLSFNHNFTNDDHNSDIDGNNDNDSGCNRDVDGKLILFMPYNLLYKPVAPLELTLIKNCSPFESILAIAVAKNQLESAKKGPNNMGDDAESTTSGNFTYYSTKEQEEEQEEVVESKQPSPSSSSSSSYIQGYCTKRKRSSNNKNLVAGK